MPVNNKQEIKRYLNVIKRAMGFIEDILDNDDGGTMEQLIDQQVPPVQVSAAVPVQPVMQPVIQQPQQPAQPDPARKNHIQELFKIDCWPEAVPPVLAEAEPTKEDQINRANNVLDFMVDRDIEGKSFLDFGCGEGWITQEVAKRGVSEVLGYDIKDDKGWSDREGSIFTSDFKEIPKQHFDFVMIYDVLDHCVDPINVMAQVRSCIKPDGIVFVRCHPWTARHATHMYKHGINKAYWHMFLTWDEVAEHTQEEPMFTRVEKDPVEAYRWWFKDFNTEKERIIEEDVSEFFLVPAFKELLANEQQMPLNEIDGYLAKMRIQFVDYCISPKKN